MVLIQAVIGDVVPPRDRGRYQGLFGAVFGIASVGGPLLGGLIVQAVSWRWIFYVNLPVGVVALGVLGVALPSAPRTARPPIDYLGATLLAGALSAIILVASLGGTTWASDSTPLIAVGALALILLGAFTVAERRAREPVIPPALVREPLFRVCGMLSLIVGFALFGSVTFLPLYFQTVDGASPTGGGLRLVPMMVGVLTMSIASGQLISRTGRYRAYPIVGTALMTAGLALLSRLTIGTSALSASLYLVLLGLGLGSTMQVLVLAVQNVGRLLDPRRRDLVGHARARHGRLARHRDLRHDLLDAAAHTPRPRADGAARAPGQQRRAPHRRSGAGAVAGGTHRLPAGLRRRALGGVRGVRVARGARLRAEPPDPAAPAARRGRHGDRARGRARRAARRELARRGRARAHEGHLGAGAHPLPPADRRALRRPAQPRRDVGADPNRRARNRARPRAGRAGRRCARAHRGRARRAARARPARAGGPRREPADSVRPRAPRARGRRAAGAAGRGARPRGPDRHPELTALLARLARELSGEPPPREGAPAAVS